MTTNVSQQVSVEEIVDKNESVDVNPIDSKQSAQSLSKSDRRKEETAQNYEALQHLSQQS